jgi:nitroreductase
MEHTPSHHPRRRSTPGTSEEPPWPIPDARMRAIEAAADQALLAPSVHNTQPWILVVEPDHLVLRADRRRQLTVIDPLGRELVQSVGAALFNVRVALAARGWDVRVERLPRRDDPDLLAVVYAVEGTPDSHLAEYDPVIPHRRTNRRPLASDTVPHDVLPELARHAAADGALLVPVVRDEHRHLVARLTQQADAAQNADRSYRAELRHWTNRPTFEGDGVPPRSVPHVDVRSPVDMPQRDFDTRGAGALPPDPGDNADRTLVLLATPTDDRAAWLRCGEALQHVLLELTRQGWIASPMSQAVEVPLTRTQLRAALTPETHPQMLLRIGHAGDVVAAPRRPRADVVRNSSRPPEPPRIKTPPPTRRPAPRTEPPGSRPVSDGRGGTTWV